jgi:hypothetical protein
VGLFPVPPVGGMHVVNSADEFEAAFFGFA